MVHTAQDVRSLRCAQLIETLEMGGAEQHAVRLAALTFGDLTAIKAAIVDALVGSIYAADTDRFSLAEVPQLAGLAEQRSLLLSARKEPGKYVEGVVLSDNLEALFRNGLEHIDSRIPVVILGSKQHLINRIFARPKAPFFNWGTHVYFEAIDYHEYWQYMDERFKQEGLRISFENAVYLQDKMSRIPEAINRLCFALLFHGIAKGEITKENIDSGLHKIVSDRRTEPEIYLSGFTASEQKVIINLAKMEPVLHPQGKDFIKSINLTAPGVRKIMMKLENEAVVYKEDAGYILADPLLKQHILAYRL